jgi:hypothetical protein
MDRHVNKTSGRKDNIFLNVFPVTLLDEFIYGIKPNDMHTKILRNFELTIWYEASVDYKPVVTKLYTPVNYATAQRHETFGLNLYLHEILGKSYPLSFMNIGQI